MGKLYKLSKYSHIVVCNEKLFLFSTLSGAILEFDLKFEKIFVEILNFDSIDEETLTKKLELAHDAFTLLLDYKIIVPIELHESNLLSEKVDLFKRKKEVDYVFTFTENCNFRCPYCFESHSSRRIDRKTLNKYIEFLNADVTERDLMPIRITYYGGEPLLEKENVLYTQKRLSSEINGRKMNYLLITNGYFLDDSFLDSLRNISNQSSFKIQITLDGPKNIHNQRRHLLNGKGTYDKVIKNLALSAKYFKTVVRINIDNLNFEYIKLLILDLSTLNLNNKNIVISPNLISTGTENSAPYKIHVRPGKQNDFYKNMKDFAEFCIGKGFQIDSYRTSYNGFPFSRYRYMFCTAIIGNQIVFCPDGYIFGCMERVSDRKYCIGNINSNPIFNERYKEWKNYNFAYDEECDNCLVSCFCGGGCPTQHLDSYNNLHRTCKKDIYLNAFDRIIK